MSLGVDNSTAIIFSSVLGLLVAIVYFYLQKSGSKEPKKEETKVVEKSSKASKKQPSETKSASPTSPLVEFPSDQELCRVQFIAHSSKCFGACWLASPSPTPTSTTTTTTTATASHPGSSGFIVTVGKDRTMLLHEVASLAEKSRRNFRINLDCGTDVPARVCGSPDGRFVLLAYKSSAAVAYQIHKKVRLN
jgi:hypothetical protein